MMLRHHRVGHDKAALRHHGDEMSIAEPIRDVPPNAQFYDLALEPAAAVARVARFLLGHPALQHRLEFCAGAAYRAGC
jgi:hypothetical protein